MDVQRNKVEVSTRHERANPCYMFNRLSLMFKYALTAFSSYGSAQLHLITLVLLKPAKIA